MGTGYGTVVITGGSEGIGLATARALAPRAGTLVLVARDERKLRLAQEVLQQACPAVEIDVRTCDVADSPAVRRTFDQIQQHAGAVDVLVNSAGISIFGPAEHTPPEAMRDVMDVDYFGAVHCALAVLPAMRTRNAGTIVNVVSVAGLHGIPYLTAYGAAKAALAVFGQGLRAELADTRIRVINVYPGYTQTTLFQKEAAYGDVHRPAGPFMPAEEVARAIVQAVDCGRPEVVLSREGRRLRTAQRWCPWLLRRALGAMARRLKGPTP